jgi:hypothetical protein
MEAAGIAPVTLLSERIAHSAVPPCRLGMRRKCVGTARVGHELAFPDAGCQGGDHAICAGKSVSCVSNVILRARRSPLTLALRMTYGVPGTPYGIPDTRLNPAVQRRRVAAGVATAVRDIAVICSFCDNGATICRTRPNAVGRQTSNYAPRPSPRALV